MLIEIKSTQCLGEEYSTKEVKEVYEYWNSKNNTRKHKYGTKTYQLGVKEIYERLNTTRFTIDDMKSAIDVYDQILHPDFLKQSFFSKSKLAKVTLSSFFRFSKYEREACRKTIAGQTLLKEISWFRFCRKGCDYCKGSLLINPIETPRNKYPQIVKTLQNHIADLRKNTYSNPNNFSPEENSILVTASCKLNVIHNKVKKKMKDDDPNHFYGVLYNYMRSNAISQPIFLASDRTIDRFMSFLEGNGYLKHTHNEIKQKHPVQIKRKEVHAEIG
jgi:hypothetical protein